MTPDRPTGSGERQQLLARQFTSLRPRLVNVAYAILGSRTEAEDVVSDTWLRLAVADLKDPVRDVEAWTVVAVARGALNEAQSARSRREHYVGPWLPEPVTAATTVADPAERVTLDASVSFALLVVLESLTPAERVSWVMHDLFGLTFTEVANVVGRTPAAVRQLATRARRHLSDQKPRLTVDPREHQAVLTRFLEAAAGGDLNGLASTLDPEVVLTSDGGGAVTAARRPVHGTERVARFLLGAAAKMTPTDEVKMIGVNGLGGIGLYRNNTLIGVISLTVVDRLIARVDIVRAPLKLGHPSTLDLR